MAFKSRSLTLVGSRIGPRANANGGVGSGMPGMQSSNSSARRTPSFFSPLLRRPLPPELFLNRLDHELHDRDVVRHAVQLEPAVKHLLDARRQLGDGLVGLCYAWLMQPYFSSLLAVT